jgi:hypothetical protein
MTESTPDKNVQTISCKTWEHFIHAVRNEEEGRVVGSRIYRGQADPAWPLSSKFERWLHLGRGKDASRPLTSVFDRDGPGAFEAGILSSFKHSAIGVPSVRTDHLTDDDWWILGRHHVLMTRLLDWTYSPYVAAFFAFVDFAERTHAGFGDGLPQWVPTLHEGHVVVYALAPFRSLLVPGEFEIVDWRRDEFHRQRAQQGLFTRLRHNTFLDLAAYLESKDMGYYLERILISSAEVGKALNDLRLMNVTYAALFPDLDGAARDTNVSGAITALGWSGTVVQLET